MVILQRSAYAGVIQCNAKFYNEIMISNTKIILTNMKHYMNYFIFFVDVCLFSCLTHLLVVWNVSRQVPCRARRTGLLILLKHLWYQTGCFVREVTGRSKFSARATFQICTTLLSVKLIVLLTFSRVRCLTTPIRNKAGEGGRRVMDGLGSIRWMLWVDK